MAPKNVCIFGLSANPPTGLLGHQGIVKALVGTGQFDEIWVLPVYKHMYSAKKVMALFEDRLEMCRLTFEPLSTYPSCRVVVKPSERSVYVKRLKANPKASSGTADVLEALQNTFPETTFSLCLGQDSYLDLVAGKWKQAESIARKIDGRFHVFERPAPAGSPKEEEGKLLAETVANENAKAALLKDPSSSSSSDATRFAFGATLHRLPGNDGDGREHVSSTTLRKLLAELGEKETGVVAEDSPLRSVGLVAPKALAYIRAEGLYNAADWEPEEAEPDMLGLGADPMMASHDEKTSLLRKRNNNNNDKSEDGSGGGVKNKAYYDGVAADQAKAAKKKKALEDDDPGFIKWVVVLMPLFLVLGLIGHGLYTSSGSGAGIRSMLPSFLGGTTAPLLTVENFEEMTEGKAIFVKFYAPWCGHCKKMKPTWDSLAKAVNSPHNSAAAAPDGSTDDTATEVQGSSWAHVLVADVDCTDERPAATSAAAKGKDEDDEDEDEEEEEEEEVGGGGRGLCQLHGVSGFPTLMSTDEYGDLVTYEGGRSLDALKSHASSLVPPCDPGHQSSCSTKAKALLEAMMVKHEKDPKGFAKDLAVKERQQEAAEEAFDAGVAQLRVEHTKLGEKREKTKERVLKQGGLKNAMAVLALRKKEEAQN